jgi:hypothetical protein
VDLLESGGGIIVAVRQTSPLLLPQAGDRTHRGGWVRPQNRSQWLFPDQTGGRLPSHRSASSVIRQLTCSFRSHPPPDFLPCQWNL